MSPSRPTASRRRRAQVREIWARGIKAKPLLSGQDHGEPVIVRARDLGVAEDRWVQPFLEANRWMIQRLDLRPETRVGPSGVALALHPGARIGAVPLVSTATRKVAAGLLIRPRFGWPSIGQVLGEVGFSVEPDLGGGPLVPGSAREVPPWILAGPVLRRVWQALRRTPRTFVAVNEIRTRPRGTVDWGHYARRSLPSGRWHELLCTFSELDRDPWLQGALRWTVGRLAVDLAQYADSVVACMLLEDAQQLLGELGPGPSRRPSPEELRRAAVPAGISFWLESALEAVGWVAEDRGLGGARSLDGLTWSLEADVLWEAWVEAVLSELAPRLGATLVRRGKSRWPLAWQTPLRSLGSLAPDLALRWPKRWAWVDAKYKAHLIHIGQTGWRGATNTIREAHRADVHQALAYAALADVPRVDTVLAYPVARGFDAHAHVGVADVAAGRKAVRLVLAGLPFGFGGPDERQAALNGWATVLNTDT